MTITPSHVLACAKALANQGGTLAENIDWLDVSGQFTDELLDQWRVIASTAEALGIGTVTAIDLLGDDIDLLAVDIGSLAGNVRVRIKKSHGDTTYYLFSAEGVTSLLSDPERCRSARVILVAEAFEPFRTESCRFEQWIGAVAEEQSPDPMAGIVPRRLVKDMIGGAVPLSVGPFLLIGDTPIDDSAVFGAWRLLAVRQLLACLANEIWADNGKAMVTLHGPRTRRIEAGFSTADSKKLLPHVTECARWVYASGRDIEVRHTLLTYELAREWPDEMPWSQMFWEKAERSLEAAKTAFHAHIRETSKDTLKSLGDLRKALGEEVAKVSQQTRDLLATLWRDFAVAVTAVVARIVLILAEKPSADSFVVKGTLVGIAGFLVFSIVFTLRSNSRFMAIADESRDAWRSKLYGFLPDSDLRVLSDIPIEQSNAVYRKAARWVVTAYAIVTIAVLVTAFLPHSLNSTEQKSNTHMPPPAGTNNTTTVGGALVEQKKTVNNLNLAPQLRNQVSASLKNQNSLSLRANGKVSSNTEVNSRSQNADRSKTQTGICVQISGCCVDACGCSPSGANNCSSPSLKNSGKEVTSNERTAAEEH